MTSKRIGLGALITAVIATLVLVTNTLDVNAQGTGSTPATRPTATAATPIAREVTLTGRVVDLHCFMTGQMPSADAAKCTADCIRAGVPAALETSSGLIVLGQGVNGPAKTLLPFAHQDVQVRGKLFERDGVKYLDIASMQKAAETTED